MSNDEDLCENGTAHQGTNTICSKCDQPTCQSVHEGLGCTKSLHHDGDHENAFGRGKEVGPWKDESYIPKDLTIDEIREAKEWQKELDREFRKALLDYNVSESFQKEDRSPYARRQDKFRYH